jgi:hypothetical protein
MNVGNELAQIKNCKTLEEIEQFLKDHNLIFDHWYTNGSTSKESKTSLYVVAYYQDTNGTFIEITFNF